MSRKAVLNISVCMVTTVGTGRVVKAQRVASFRFFYFVLLKDILLDIHRDLPAYIRGDSLGVRDGGWV